MATSIALSVNYASHSLPGTPAPPPESELHRTNQYLKFYNDPNQPDLVVSEDTLLGIFHVWRIPEDKASNPVLLSTISENYLQYPERSETFRQILFAHERLTLVGSSTLFVFRDTDGVEGPSNVVEGETGRAVASIDKTLTAIDILDLPREKGTRSSKISVWKRVPVAPGEEPDR